VDLPVDEVLEQRLPQVHQPNTECEAKNRASNELRGNAIGQDGPSERRFRNRG
jgi:hypothetical protein